MKNDQLTITLDTVNLDIFKLHLAWVDYINKASRGVFTPKRDYIKKRILDYACSCYYDRHYKLCRRSA